MSPQLNNNLPPIADTAVSDLTILSQDERVVVRDLYYESINVTDHAEQYRKLQEFGQFAGEIALNGRVQQQAQHDLMAARTFGARMRAETETHIMPTTDLDGGKLGWLNHDQVVSVDLEKQGTAENSFLYGAITDEHTITADALEHLVDEGEADKLLQALKDSAIPLLLNQVKTNTGKLRPVNYVNDKNKKQRNLNTSYPAFKLDVHGTSNRAIVLLPEKLMEFRL